MERKRAKLMMDQSYVTIASGDGNQRMAPPSSSSSLRENKEIGSRTAATTPDVSLLSGWMLSKGNRASGLMADKWRLAWSINRSSSLILPSYLYLHIHFFSLSLPPVSFVYHISAYCFMCCSLFPISHHWKWRHNGEREEISSSLTGQFLYDLVSPFNRVPMKIKHPHLFFFYIF